MPGISTTGQITITDLNDHVNVTSSIPPPPTSPTPGDLWINVDTTGLNSMPGNGATYYYDNIAAWSLGITYPRYKAVGALYDTTNIHSTDVTYKPSVGYWVLTSRGGTDSSKVVYNATPPTGSFIGSPLIFRNGDIWVRTPDNNIYYWVYGATGASVYAGTYWSLTNDVRKVIGLYDAMASDGVLSQVEKPRVTLDYNTFLIDSVDIIRNAQLVGLDFSVFFNTCDTLTNYMENTLHRMDLDRTQDSQLAAFDITGITSNLGSYASHPAITSAMVNSSLISIYTNTSNALLLGDLVYALDKDLSHSPKVPFWTLSGGEIFTKVWTDYFTQKNAILIQMQSASVPTATALSTTAISPLTGITSSTISVPDISTLPSPQNVLYAGDTVFLTGQSPNTQNGLYKIVREGTSGTSAPQFIYPTLPSANVINYLGITGSDPKSYFVSPYVSLSRTQIFTWAATETYSGVLKLTIVVSDVADTAPDWAGGKSAMLQYSTDAGTTWTYFTQYSINAGSTWVNTISNLYPTGYTYNVKTDTLSGIVMSNLRVKLVVYRSKVAVYG